MAKLPGFSRYIASLIISLYFSLSIPQPESDVQHVFTVLSGFFRRGQIFLETFPPAALLLSALTSTQSKTLSFLCVVTTSLSILYATGDLFLYGDYTTTWAIVPCLSVVYSLVPIGPMLSSLTLASNIADTFLIASACILQTRIANHSQRIQILAAAGVPELLSVTALLLGCNGLDFLASTCFILLHCWNGIGDVTQQASLIALRVTIKHIRLLSVYALVLILAFGSILPFSEVNYGGNYNLQYFSPNFRSYMRPSISRFISSADEAEHPENALLTNHPYSLYLPEVGFLSSDSQIWDTHYRAFLPDFLVEPPRIGYIENLMAFNKGLPPEFNHRVIYRDHINNVAPWILQKVTKERSSENTTLTSELVRSGQLVTIMHAESFEYLVAEQNVTATIDREFIIDVPESQRLQVSATPEKRPEAVWEVYFHDLDNGDGFHLYNPKSGCFLASSFRTFPDFHGRKTNDTILHELLLELETVCLRDASDRASKFYVVDGVAKSSTTGTSSEALSWLKACSIIPWRSVEVLSALHRLRTFRRRFPDLQDIPPSLLKAEKVVIQASIDHKTDISFGFLVVINMIYTLYRRRMEAGAGHRGGLLQPLTKYGVFLAGAHLFWYCLLGAERLYGNRVAGIISMVSWAYLIRDIASSFRKTRSMFHEGDGPVYGY